MREDPRGRPGAFSRGSDEVLGGRRLVPAPGPTYLLLNTTMLLISAMPPLTLLKLSVRWSSAVPDWQRNPQRSITRAFSPTWMSFMSFQRLYSTFLTPLAVILSNASED